MNKVGAPVSFVVWCYWTNSSILLCCRQQTPVFFKQKSGKNCVIILSTMKNQYKNDVLWICNIFYLAAIWCTILWDYITVNLRKRTILLRHTVLALAKQKSHTHTQWKSQLQPLSVLQKDHNYLIFYMKKKILLLFLPPSNIPQTNNHVKTWKLAMYTKLNLIINSIDVSRDNPDTVDVS